MKITINITGKKLKYMQHYAKVNGFDSVADLTERAVDDWYGVALDGDKCEEQLIITEK